ncbi:aminotransferase class V-fold PLP-dependent enzyme [Ornithinimicrobium tianjinense]|uniref:Cysteine desulfurase n=1 Tax=Ornithinimicrobium tianjinense TaxID=1195761 RepID=A0A917F588_9MICO|nr:SufS family cysteine desulfurase [Ornithinimicrobium tianjinense]GGF47945.1 cysteine desulfurase [Ornithinimicrobium tianjinense]
MTTGRPILHGASSGSATGFSGAELAALRADFPLLSRTVRDGRPLVYLDSGATAQKPGVVLDAEREFYERHNAAVHRGAHQLAEEATEAFEGARTTVARFLGADEGEIVFTRNGTEGLNLLAYGFSNAAAPGALDGVDPEWADRLGLGPGDEVVVTEMEHHANLVPWQELCRRTGATLRWIGVTDDGYLEDPATVVGERTKVVSVTHVSNVLGTLNDLTPVIAAARGVGALVFVDACQSAPHLDITGLTAPDSGVDALVLTGHKTLGPSGIGVLWARRALLEALPPFLTGGSMIEIVRMEGSTWAPPPQKFEAGVPMTAQAVGLAAALDYLTDLGLDRVHAHDQSLVRHTLDALAQRPWVRVLGPTDPADRVGAVAFVVDGVHPHDVGQVLDDAGVAVRTGHHCAWPLHRRLRVPASTRASFSVYTTPEEIDAFTAALDRVPEIFGVAS